MNHTPGPWAMQVFKAVNGDLCPGVVGANGAAVAWMNNETDTRLVAAAPELLDLLKELIDLEGPQPGNSAWGIKANALIAKAMGEAS